MNILGVMSGSSLDGVDVALVQFSSQGYQLISAKTLPMDIDLASRLRSYEDCSVAEYLILDRDFTMYIGKLLALYTSTLEQEIDAISIHGHTIIHIPNDNITVQMGNAGAISAMTGIDVVADFRIQDIYKGGEGTPLVSIADRYLYEGYDFYINLGGIANITEIVADKIAAYDICPCNQILNYFTKKLLGKDYDEGGSIARTGKLLPDLTYDINQLKYWAKAPPKSLDNNWIKSIFLSKIDDNHKAEDILHTMSMWIAEMIYDSLKARPGKVLVTGGGAYNKFLIDTLKLKCPNHEIILPANEIIDFKEAILMAYLGYLRLNGKPNVMHQVTFADTSSIAGAHYKALKE